MFVSTLLAIVAGISKRVTNDRGNDMDLFIQKQASGVAGHRVSGAMARDMVEIAREFTWGETMINVSTTR